MADTITTGTYTVKNVTEAGKGGGPRGFVTAANGLQMLDPGDSVDVTLTDEEHGIISGYGGDDAIFEVSEQMDADTSGVHARSENLPASGQVDKLSGAKTLTSDSKPKGKKARAEAQS